METSIGWDQYKAQASVDISNDNMLIYRGQSNSDWKLSSSLHRTPLVGGPSELETYTNVVVPQVLEGVEAWSGQAWNTKTPDGLAEALAFLQHNGFPTPLIDWSWSPYIAAFFAYESVNHFQPQSKNVAIYSFDQKHWSEVYERQSDFADHRPHVSMLQTRLVGNHKLAMQQGLFTWTNQKDAEAHIRTCEVNGLEFLKKYVLPVQERPRVMRELSLMGISAVQLAPSVESVCKKALEDLIHLQPVGKIC